MRCGMHCSFRFIYLTKLISSHVDCTYELIDPQIFNKSNWHFKYPFIEKIVQKKITLWLIMVTVVQIELYNHYRESCSIVKIICKTLVVYLDIWNGSCLWWSFTFSLLNHTLSSGKSHMYLAQRSNVVKEASTNGHCWKSNPRPFNHSDWVWRFHQLGHRNR